MWYFAYDHLAHPDELHDWAATLPARVRRPAARQPGVLKNFRLQFAAYSQTWQGGLADMTPDPGKSLAGALLQIPDSALPYLDRFHDVQSTWSGQNQGQYRRLKVSVLPFGIEPAVEAITYQLTSPSPSHIPPSERYLNLLQQAAANLRHSAMWLAHLQTFAPRTMTTHAPAAAR